MIQALQSILASPWAISRNGLQSIISTARSMGVSPTEAAERMAADALEGFESRTSDSGVAVIPVQGPLMRTGGLFSRIFGYGSYRGIASVFNEALDDGAVRAIVLDIDSPGGDVRGLYDLAETIFKARGEKPITAYVSGEADSAAYWIASAADEIVSAPQGMVGSIGVVMTIIDFSKMDEEIGIEEIEIVSSQSPNKRLDPKESGDRARLQTRVDDLAQVFVDTVARNRGTTTDEILSDYGQGDVFVAQRALDAGMIDRIGLIDDVIADLDAPQQEDLFPNSVPAAVGHSTRKEGAMYLTSEAPAAGEEQQRPEVTAENLALNCPEVAEALRAEGEQRVEAPDVEAAVKAERDRVAGIINCEEAKGREGLAQQLALTEGMTVESAQRILAAQPKASGGQSWVAGMEGADVDVGADGPEGGDNDPKQVAQATVQAAREAGYIR